MGMILDTTTKETMSAIRNPSDHSANFGRGAHANHLPRNSGHSTIKLVSLCSLYSDYFYHDHVAIFVKMNNCTRE